MRNENNLTEMNVSVQLTTNWKQQSITLIFFFLKSKLLAHPADEERRGIWTSSSSLLFLIQNVFSRKSSLIKTCDSFWSLCRGASDGELLWSAVCEWAGWVSKSVFIAIHSLSLSFTHEHTHTHTATLSPWSLPHLLYFLCVAGCKTEIECCLWLFQLKYHLELASKIIC